MLDFSNLYEVLLDQSFNILILILACLAFELVFMFFSIKLINRVFHILSRNQEVDYLDIQSRVKKFFRWLISCFTIVLLFFGLLGILGDGIIGNIRITPSILIELLSWLFSWAPRIILIILISSLADRFFKYIIPTVVEFQIRNHSDNNLESEQSKNIETLGSVLTKVVSLLILSFASFMILGEIGIDLAPLLLAAGVVGIAVGFGAQNLVRDIFSGVFIILENQYRVGDIVKIAGIGGLVEDINLRRTILRDLDYRQHYIPNGEIRTASNYTKDKSRVNFNIGVSYNENLDHVLATLNTIGEEMSRDDEWKSVILDPIKAIRVDNFGDSSIDIRILGETIPMRQWDAAGEYRLRVKRVFDELGIEIPFPQRDVHLYGDSPTKDGN
jgi:small conductance mechanosensitive channel